MVKRPEVVVLKSAGTNCDEETKIAFELAGAHTEIIYMDELYRKKKNLDKFHIIVFPGGFSYGDDIAAGKVWAIEIKHFFIEKLRKFVDDGKLVLGICNGFQVLVKLGLLPAIDGRMEQSVSLVFNTLARYEDRWIYLKKCSEKSVFVKDIGGLLYMPVAHAEGKFITRDDETLRKLFENYQVVFQYVDMNGKINGFPANPNGSVKNIAGICDSTGRILGMMPHPERAVLETQYPNWRRNKVKTSMMGLNIIKNGVHYIKRNFL